MACYNSLPTSSFFYSCVFLWAGLFFLHNSRPNKTQLKKGEGRERYDGVGRRELAKLINLFWALSLPPLSSYLSQQLIHYFFLVFLY